MKSVVIQPLWKIITAKEMLYFLVAGVLFSACTAGHSLTSFEPPKPKNYAENVHGAYARIYGSVYVDVFGTENSGYRQLANGELIAVNDTQIILLVDTGLEILSFSNVSEIRLELMKTTNGGEIITVIAVLMPLTSLAHGYGAAVTFPLNIIASTVIILKANSRYTIDYERPIPNGKKVHLHGTFDKKILGKFARFPQGLPGGITASSLR